jgi:hypothetical protein
MKKKEEKDELHGTHTRTKNNKTNITKIIGLFLGPDL